MVSMRDTTDSTKRVNLKALFFTLTMLSVKLQDKEFSNVVIRFMEQFNPEVEWDIIIKNWIAKNKTDEQIYNDIHSLTWVDKEIEADDKVLPVFVHITSNTFDLFHEAFLKRKKIMILDYDTDLASARGEQAMEMYKEALIDILTARLIKYEFTNTVTENIYDFGFFYTSDENLQKLEKSKSYHFDFLGVNSYKYVKELRKLYAAVD